MNATKSLELIADLGVAAIELRKLPREDVKIAFTFMRKGNPEMWRWLSGLLIEVGAGE